MEHPTIVRLVEEQKELHPVASKPHKGSTANSTLFNASSTIESILESQVNGSGLTHASNLLFHVRFLVIAGAKHITEVVDKLNAARGAAHAQVCTAEHTALIAGRVVSARLEALLHACEDEELHEAEFMGDQERFAHAVVFAAYARHSMGIWRAYNDAMNTRTPLEDAGLQAAVRELKEARRPLVAALKTFLNRSDPELESALRNALLVPELVRSRLNDVAFGHANTVFKKVQLLEKEWEKELTN